jgi:amino acid adenylation domain-containing protein
LLSPLEFRQYEGLFDLYLELWDHPDTLLGTIKYTPDLFDTSTMERMAGHFQTLLTNIVAENPLGVAQRISDLQLLTATERHEILVEWNHLVPHPDVNQRPDDAKDKCIQQWFEDQVERTPDAVAVVLPSPIPHQGLTYRALNARANQLAHYLQSLGVGSHLGSATPVGLCIDRSIEMVVGILGILKAGGIYVPLDRDYPKERLAFMAADTAVSVLLTRERLLNDLPEHQAHVVCLDKHWDIIALASQQNLPIAISGANTAYILYTSGSTGRPKGVTMPHVALANLIQWQLEQTKTPRPQTLQFAPISFDVSVQEIFSTLCAGGRLFLIPEETRRDSEALLGFLTYHRIERLFLPFVALQQLAEIAREQPLPTSLREVITAGEQLQITPAIASLFERLPSCILSNHYGPTESHVVTAFDLTGSVHDWPTSPPIGRPIANTQIYILDRHRQPTLVGVPGELHIGGIQLASGYHNRASLTEDKFIPNPFAPTEYSDRLYRTGDLARYRPDGNIEFLGRMDSQIKLRGFRIELGEIEHVLSQHPDVQDAIVVTRDEALEGHHTLSSDKRLVAYLVLDRASQDAQSEDELLLKIRRYLQAKLPDYMVPAAFVMIDIDALPLTPTGKVDHKALPAPAVFHRILADTFVPPRTQTEERLAAIWSEKLRVDQIGMHDDFFELGGHSLLATQVIAKMAEICSVEVPLRSLFELRTIERLAQHVLQLQQTGASETYSHAWPQVVPAPEQRYEPFPLTDVQHAYWVGRNDLFELGHVAAHIYLEIEGEGLDLQRLTETWRQLIDRHEMLRAVVRPDGQQQILADVPAYCFTVYDLSTGDSHTVQTHLASIREEMSHQVLPADTWPLFDIRATWLTGQQRRLHISLDALILDGWSLLLLFQEWLTLYQDPTRGLPPLELSFRDYVLTEPAVERLNVINARWPTGIVAWTHCLRPQNCHWLGIPRACRSRNLGGTLSNWMPSRGSY